VLHEAQLKYRTQKNCQKIASCTPPHVFTICWTSGWDRLGSLRHPSKFQWVSRLDFVTAPTSLNGGQPNVAQCLAISSANTPYTKNVAVHLW